MGDINLLPQLHAQEEMKKRMGRLSIVIIIALGILVVSLAAYGYLFYIQQNLITETMSMDSRIKQLSSVYDTKNKIQIQDDKNKKLENTKLKEAKTSIVGTDILDKINKSMPDSIFAVNISAANLTDININGKSKDCDSIAYFAFKLKQVQGFAEVSVKSISGAKAQKASTDSKISAVSGNPDEYSFTITIKTKQ